MAEPFRKKKKMAEPFRIGVGTGVSDYIDKLNAIPQAAKDVFLWELVRNARNALYEIRRKTMYKAYRNGDGDGDGDGKKDLFITIIPDKRDNTLSIVDNGVGMTEDDLKRLFTIPQPKLKTYMKVADQLVENKVTARQFCTPDTDLYGGYSTDEDEDEDDDDEEVVYKDLKANDLSLGFFAAFMVADRVKIVTKHSGVGACPFLISGDRSGFFCDVHATFDDKSHPWATFDDKSCPSGTSVTLYLKDDYFDYLDPKKLKLLINDYPLQLCPHPISIRGVRPSGKLMKVRRRTADVKDEEKGIKLLENQFEDLRKLFKEVLGTWTPVKQVVISDRFYDIPTFLTPDKKTLIINPRHWIIRTLNEPPADRNLFVGAIKLQYLASQGILSLYQQH